MLIYAGPKTATSMQHDYDVIVIGAGFAGIHTVAELERRSPGLRTLTLEARERIAGRAWTRPARPDGGPAADMGAHYFGRDHRRVWSLARRLLGDPAIYSHIGNFGADPAFRNFLDREWRVTTRNSSFFNIQGLSKQAPLLDRLRIFESLTWHLTLEALVDVREPWNTPWAEILDRVNLGEWIADQNMPRWIDELWDLGCTGLLSAAPEQISLLYWLWYTASNGGFLQAANDFTGGPQEFGVRGGLGELARRHAASLRGELRLSAPVVAIDHREPDHVRVTLAGGEELTAGRVVVAVSPATVGRTIEFRPGLSAARERLHAQAMGHACKAVIRYPTPWWRASHGLHFIGYGGGAGSRGAEWALDASDPADGRATLLVFLHPEIFGAGESGLEARVAAEVERISGDPRAHDYDAMDLIDWTAEPFIGGGPNTIMSSGVLSQLGPVFRQPEPPHGRLYFTAAEYAHEYCGYVEGALEAGEHTAAQIHADMLGRPRRRVRARGPRPLRALAFASLHATIAAIARLVALALQTQVEGSSR